MSDDRDTEPSTDLSVEANGIDFECLRAGDGDRLALCLHGFPDDAGSMRPVLERLADAGFTAVAPYIRGYAPTDRPTARTLLRARPACNCNSSDKKGVEPDRPS